MIVYAFSLVFPYLLVLALVLAAAARFGVDCRGGKQRMALCAASLVIILIPLRWIPLGRWIVGWNANFSIPLTALLLSRVWEQLRGARLLDRREALAAWVFGLASGLALYPMALGLGGFDPYELGRGFSWLFVLLVALTIALLRARNRFGIVLVVTILVYDLGLLESPNLWDYLVDPFYALAAAGVLVHRLVRAMIWRGDRRTSAPAKAGAGD